MEAREYDVMYRFETDYWWYRAMHALIRQWIGGLRLAPGARLLDAGCGTGGALAALADLDLTRVGFDFSPHAARFWAARGLERAALASINAIPFADGVFDVAMSIDVLESEAVDEDKAIRELWRVVRPGGYLLLCVPAYRWLLNESHHRAVHATRRYTRPEAVRLIGQVPVTLKRATHYYAAPFPLIAGVRLLQKTRPAGDDPQSDLTPLPRLVNSGLYWLMAAERAALHTIDLPFGTSILVLAQKQKD